MNVAASPAGLCRDVAVEAGSDAGQVRVDGAEDVTVYRSASIALVACTEEVIIARIEPHLIAAARQRRDREDLMAVTDVDDHRPARGIAAEERLEIRTKRYPL